LLRANPARLHIHAREQRHLLPDVGPLGRLLLEHGAPIEYRPGRTETEVTTIYLDTAEGTWSRGLSPTKFRLRSYQDPQRRWLEVKRRLGTVVDKWRRPLDRAALGPVLDGSAPWKRIERLIGRQPLLPLVAVRYWRTAFEWPGLRLTLDREVSFYTVDRGSACALDALVGGVVGFIVEVKREDGVPAWLDEALAPYRLEGFSKSRTALAAARAANPDGR
jgi:hypothetical protein